MRQEIKLGAAIAALVLFASSGSHDDAFAARGRPGDRRPTRATSSAAAIDSTAPTDGAALTLTPGDTSITLSWNAASDNVGVDHYEVRVATGTQTAPASCSAGSTVTGCNDPTGTSCTATGLTNETSYAFRVCAVDAAGNVSTGRTEWDQPFVDAYAITFDGAEILSAADNDIFECNDEDQLTLIASYYVDDCDGSPGGCDDLIVGVGPNTNVTANMLSETRGANGFGVRTAINALAQWPQAGLGVEDFWTKSAHSFDAAQVDGGDSGTDPNDERSDQYVTVCTNAVPPVCPTFATDLTAGLGACGAQPCFLGTMPALIDDRTTNPRMFIGGYGAAGNFNTIGRINEVLLACNGKVTAAQINDCIFDGATAKFRNLLTLSKRTSGGTSCATIFNQARAWYRMGDGDSCAGDSWTVRNHLNPGVGDLVDDGLECGDSTLHNL